MFLNSSERVSPCPSFTQQEFEERLKVHRDGLSGRKEQSAGGVSVKDVHEYSGPFSLSFLSCSTDVPQPFLLALFKPSSQPPAVDRGTVCMSCASVRQDKHLL